MAGAEELNAGDMINERFEIKRELGRGGFATVFEGVDTHLDRRVAIKVLHGAVLSKRAQDHRIIERFEREAKLAASVDHPSVVNIYDAGEIEHLGEPFIVMEFLSGISLQDYLDEHGAIAPEVLLPLFKQVLIGLGFAHEKGIVHKDLKPDNIFYRYPDTIRQALCIVDFGIAHIGRSDSHRVTRDGEFFGTPMYMPPEYISSQQVSAACDVYQMGLILIECLSGEPVVRHQDAMATLLMHLNRTFTIPDALLDSQAWPILERALSLDPEGRYADAMQFAEALATLPLSAWPSSEALRGGDASKAPRRLTAVEDRLDSADQEAISRAWHEEVSYRTLTDVSATKQGELPDLLRAPRAPSQADEAAPPRDPSFDESPLDARSDRRLLGVIAALVGTLIVIAALIATELAQNETPPPLDPVASASIEALASPEPDVKPLDVHPTDPPIAQQVIEQAPSIVSVSLSGEPPGASVSSASGEPLGEAPLELEFESLKAPARRVVVSRQGYEPLALEISPSLSAAGARYDLEPSPRRERVDKPPRARRREEVIKAPPEEAPSSPLKLPGSLPEKQKPAPAGILLPQ